MKRKVLTSKKIIVAVTGSVAAYKSIDLIRALKKENAAVKVIMTSSAANFVTPYSLKIASGDEVITDMFSDPFAHIEIPKWADALVVAPATANTISKFYCASADDIVGACFLAFEGPVIVAPAMNWRMYTNPIFVEKLDHLKDKGIIEVKPERGDLACGEEGIGRMAGVDSIVESIKKVLAVDPDLSKKKLVITAGPTREYIDPVRFISNRSSGKMGYAIAMNALSRGAEVTLISGPTWIDPPKGARTILVETAEEMMASVSENADKADALIMAAAVADYAPAKKSGQKEEKKDSMFLELRATEDILKAVASMKRRPVIVGFAAETGQNRERAREKLVGKNMDLIVFNDVTLSGSGFDVDTNKVTIMDGTSEEEHPLMSKHDVAAVILDRVASLLS